MRKVYVMLILSLIIVAALCGCEKDVKSNDEAKKLNKIFEAETIDNVLVCMSDEWKYYGSVIDICGDYKILTDLNTEKDVERFLKCFKNWDSKENLFMNSYFETVGKICYKVSDNLLITCSTEKVKTEEFGEVYVGSVKNMCYAMSDELGELSKELYDSYFDSATKRSDIPNVLVNSDLSKNEFIDFNLLNENYNKTRCSGDFYSYIQLDSDAKPGMSFEEFQELLINDSDKILVDHKVFDDIYSLKPFYECPTPAFEKYSSSRVLCYFSNDKLVGALYYRFNFHNDTYFSMQDYYNNATRVYCTQHGITYDPFHMEDVGLNYNDDDIFYDRPVVEEENISVDVYYWNLKELEHREYKALAFSMKDEENIVLYATDESIDLENIDSYVPENDEEAIIITNGKIIPQLGL